MRFSPDMLKLIVGTPFGQYVDRTQPPGLAVDGRTAALRVLRAYVSELTFWRKGTPNIPFKITRDNFLIEWPDRPVDLTLPALVCTPSTGKMDYLGIGANFIEEQTRDVFGHGTVIQRQSQYTEAFNLLVLAGARAERRSLLAGIETQLSPTESNSGLKLRMPEYYNRIACFSLNSRTLQDAADVSGEGRRTALIAIEMRFETVSLVSYGELQPPTYPGVGDQVGPDVEFEVGSGDE